MEAILSADRRFYTVQELKEQGLSYYKIGKLIGSGRLEKLNKQLYENLEYRGDISDFASAMAYIPKGVICMLSAARYYGLTTFLPDGVDIAIEKSMKVSTMPEWPKVNVWFFPASRFEPGITRVRDAAGEYAMYDIEKTVVDILYYRNKIGIEVTKEVLKNYLAKSDRNLVRLHRYAEALGCGKILGTYLEVLV